MKILVTGSSGFVGKNLVAELRNQGFENILEYDVDSKLEDLETYTKEADFVFHLAGVNRPDNEDDFKKGNFGFTSTLLDLLKKNNNKSPIVLSSSIQALLDNPYGISKKMGEDLLVEYGKENDVKVYIYRLPNLFGKWCKPNYNSVIATFCNNIANDLPIKVNDPNVNLNLVYIDDLINDFIDLIKTDSESVYREIKPITTVSLGDIVDLLNEFKDSRDNKFIANMGDDFTKKLYATYLTYLPEDKFSYPLKMNVDNRGSFTEFVKSTNHGQVSVNISKPGIVKGNHWHHSKNEKFLVVSGEGVIRFRKYNEEKILEYFVNGENLEVVDIPPGYTHNIENLGKNDMVTIMWVNEPFDSNKPDTFFEEV